MSEPAPVVPHDLMAPLKLLGMDFWTGTCARVSQAMAHVVGGAMPDSLFYLSLSPSRFPDMWRRLDARESK